MHSKQNLILQTLTEAPEGLTALQIAKAVGRSTGGVYTSLNSLEEHNKISAGTERPKMFKIIVTPKAPQLKALGHKLKILANRIASGKESVLQGLQEAQEAITLMFPIPMPEPAKI